MQKHSLPRNGQKTEMISVMTSMTIFISSQNASTAISFGFSQ